MPKEGHCPICGGIFPVTQATHEGDAGHSLTNEAANHRLVGHEGKDGGLCGQTDLPPDRLV